MNVYLMRVNAAGTRYWCLCDKEHLLRSGVRESRNSLIDRWIEKHGQPSSITRYKGALRPSEASMTISSIMRKEEKR